MLEYIPNKFITLELCEIAVKNNWKAIEYIPDKFKNIDIMLYAVKQDVNAIEHILHNSYNKCLEYILHNDKKFFVKYFDNDLNMVPNNYKTYEICLEFVKNNYYNIKYVPDNLKTDKDILLYNNINKLNKYHKTNHMNKYILTKYYNNSIEVPIMYILENLPVKFITYEMCLKWVNSDYNNIKYIPYNLKTLGICLNAMLKYKEVNCTDYWPASLDYYMDIGVDVSNPFFYPEFLEHIPKTKLKKCLKILYKHFHLNKHCPTYMECYCTLKNHNYK